MQTTRIRWLRAVAAATLLLGLLGVARPAESIKWTITVTPAAGGCVGWSTSAPVRNGDIERKKVITFDPGSDVDLFFYPKGGYELVSVKRDDREFISRVEDDHIAFGVVNTAHEVTVTYGTALPNGRFLLSSPLDNPNVASIVALTGNYFGVTPSRAARNYNVDVAMDESGKLTGMGDVEGFVPDSGGDLTCSGRVKTVNSEPTLTAKTKFSGTRDGVVAKSTASVKGPAKLEGPGGNAAQVSMSYFAKAGGIPFKGKNLPVQMPLEPANVDNVSRAWSLQLDLVERAAKKARKPHVAAVAVLTLPGGDKIEFAEKKAKFSAKSGIKVKLRKGTNTTLNPPAVDKKTTLTIKNLTLEKIGDMWQPTGGTIQYKFLGQKGSAPLLEFLGN